MRLRNAYIIRCDSVEKNSAGEVIKLFCHVDKETLGKNPEDRKVKGVIHWVHADSVVEVRYVSSADYFRRKTRSEPG